MKNKTTFLEDYYAYHTTPHENLPFIAQDGLVPNDRRSFNWSQKDLQKNSSGRTFFWPLEGKSRDYSNALHDVGHYNNATLRVKVKSDLNLKKKDGITGKEEPIHIPPDRADIFRHFDPKFYSNKDLAHLFTHQWVTRQNIKPEKIEFYDATLGGDGYQDISAHHPETYFKLEGDSSRHVPGIERPKGQMSLFPLELYSETVNNIVDRLLNE